MTPQENILTAILNCRRVDLYTRPCPLDQDQQEQFESMMRRFEQGEPLQYIVGFTEFMGHKLIVNRHVLIPRPETEILVEESLLRLRASGSSQAPGICDLGTGSGNIAVAVAAACDACRVDAVDVSAEALKVAQANAGNHGLQNRIRFHHKDMIDFLVLSRARQETFDLILSNPPYIPASALKDLPHDVQQEPAPALNGGEDGLSFIRDLIDQAPYVLSDGGWLMIECGDGQNHDIDRIVSQYPILEREWITDYTQTPRIVAVRKQDKNVNKGTA